ncbi:MAG: CapA family protein [Lapillicoccus sp.]
MRRAIRRAGVGALLVGATLLTSACVDPEPEPPAAATTSVPSPASPASPAATAVPTATPALTADSPITLAFGGDVHFEGVVARLLTGGDSLAALRTVLGPADVAVVNLETAITDRGTEQPKIYHFRTSPAALTTLQQAGVDAVSMANNHAVDYGADGLADTLAAQAASPIPVVGIGRDAAQAFAPAVFTVRGTTVAVLASTQVDDFTVHAFPATDSRPGIAGNLDDTRLLSAVRSAREAYDVVVVFLHWGSDYVGCPDGPQVATATALSRAGADVVVGGHSHRVQGAGWLGRTYIGYGLGNFVWLNSRGPADAVSGVLTVAVDPVAARAGRGQDAVQRAAGPSVVTSGTWTPLVIGADGVPVAPGSAAAAAQNDAWSQARTCARLASHP